jgi:putative MATE family efflux protein
MSTASPAVFTQGSTMRHVIVMTGTASVGLLAIFMVEFLSLLYVSWLGDKTLTAAVGFGTVLLFIATSVNIGLMIAGSALTSRAIGAGDRAVARRLAGSAVLHTIIISGAVTIGMLLALPWLLERIGATGETAEVARRFLLITLPSNVLMATGMAFSGVLRAVGDARRAMNVTLVGAIATAIADPILIFGLGLGVDGAAWGTVVSRLFFAGVGFYGAVKVHGLVARPEVAAALKDLRPMLAIALPAILTNVAHPLASAFVTVIASRFGDPMIAANAVVDRLMPVAFCGLFALSGAVGPILGQNLGAGRFDRMRRALKDALIFATVYVAVVGGVLALGSGTIASLFALQGLAAEIVILTCLISGPAWLFVGHLFVSNAVFNNLGFPLYSTAFNWGRATLGTVPFVWLGAEMLGPKGVPIGLGAGGAIFGIIAVVVAFNAITRLERRAGAAAPAVRSTAVA